MNLGGEIVPLKVLLAIEDAIQFVKQYSHVEGLFCGERGSYIKSRIFQAMRRGDRKALHQLLNPNSEELSRMPWLAEVGFATVETYIAMECSAALTSLLSCLPRPLFPMRVQGLVLRGNEGIPVEDVARDALGLLKQDLTGRHLILATSFLDLLHSVSKKARFSELGGPSVAASLLPVLFNLQDDDMSRWQHSAAIFSELISMSPKYLTWNLPTGSGEADNSPFITARATPSEISQGTQGPAMDITLPGHDPNHAPGAGRRPRRRSPRRCALTNFGGPDGHLAAWGAQMQGALHPMLAGYHQ